MDRLPGSRQFILLAAFAPNSVVGDDAGWADRFLAFGAAVNPWLISATVAFAAGELVEVMSGGESQQ